MLVVTLVCAVVGFGFLVTALLTGAVVWAWVCIAVCVVATALLVVSWVAPDADVLSWARTSVPLAGRRNRGSIRGGGADLTTMKIRPVSIGGPRVRQVSRRRK